MILRYAAIALVTLAAAGCGAETPTSATSVTSVLNTKTFTGTLAVGGFRFYSFTVTASGAVTAMLASVTSPPRGAALQRSLEIAVGIPAGTGCSPRQAAVVPPALVAQVSVPVQPGIVCLRVADPGDLTDVVNFAVRFTYP
jgi:hypothetical protein